LHAVISSAERGWPPYLPPSPLCAAPLPPSRAAALALALPEQPRRTEPTPLPCSSSATTRPFTRVTEAQSAAAAGEGVDRETGGLQGQLLSS
jgi:hypothetical protein